MEIKPVQLKKAQQIRTCIDKIMTEGIKPFLVSAVLTAFGDDFSKYWDPFVATLSGSDLEDIQKISENATPAFKMMALDPQAVFRSLSFFKNASNQQFFDFCKFFGIPSNAAPENLSANCHGLVKIRNNTTGHPSDNRMAENCTVQVYTELVQKCDRLGELLLSGSHYSDDMVRTWDAYCKQRDAYTPQVNSEPFCVDELPGIADMPTSLVSGFWQSALSSPFMTYFGADGKRFVLNATPEAFVDAFKKYLHLLSDQQRATDALRTLAIANGEELEETPVQEEQPQQAEAELPVVEEIGSKLPVQEASAPSNRWSWLLKYILPLLVVAVLLTILLLLPHCQQTDGEVAATTTQTTASTTTTTVATTEKTTKRTTTRTTTQAQTAYVPPVTTKAPTIPTTRTTKKTTTTTKAPTGPHISGSAVLHDAFSISVDQVQSETITFTFENHSIYPCTLGWVTQSPFVVETTKGTFVAYTPNTYRIQGASRDKITLTFSGLKGTIKTIMVRNICILNERGLPTVSGGEPLILDIKTKK